MIGPTMTMASAIETDLPFPHSPTSHLPVPPSSPNLLTHPSNQVAPLDLPALISFDFDSKIEETLRLDPKIDFLGASSPLDENKAVLMTATTQDDSLSDLSMSKNARPGPTESLMDRPRSWFPGSKSAPDVRAECLSGRRKPETKKGLPKTEAEMKPLERSWTVDSVADLVKRSWSTSTSSSSPPHQSNPFALPQRPATSYGADTNDLVMKESSHQSNHLQKSRSAKQPPKFPSSLALGREMKRPSDPSSSSSGRALNRASVFFTKFRPISSTASPTNNDVLAPALSSAMHSSSGVAADARFARNSSQSASCSSATDMTSEDASQSTGHTPDTGSITPQTSFSDPLWTLFQNLEVNLTQFHTRDSCHAKMVVVRTFVLPFLQNTADHASNSDGNLLTPDMVNYRATILDGWWNGLLALLDSSMAGLTLGNPPRGLEARLQDPTNEQYESVSSIDRPSLFEALALLTRRPEWRLLTSHFQPLRHRSPTMRVRVRSGTLSTLASNASDAEDSGAEKVGTALVVEKNVRKIFVNNLSRQMAIVVEQMSARQVSPNLVNFSGIATAYAFFFAPGVADMLSCLWLYEADTLFRLCDEFGLARRDRGESDDIVSLFPPALGRLGWRSARLMADNLRTPPTKLPMRVSRIAWDHPTWFSRWRGGATSLLFVFAKHYHILADQFMPSGLPLVEKARAPALVLLHAQLLAVLERTIHRHPAIDAIIGPPMADTLDGADAPMTLSLSPGYLGPGVDENRVLGLLRDMLTPTSDLDSLGAQETFAEAFMRVIKAVVKRTPRFAQSPCAALCDLLEEALPIYHVLDRHCHGSAVDGSPPRPGYIEWPFWIDVCQQILSSNNTMSEIRLLSFVYTIWDVITCDPARKEQVCCNWLLRPDVFEKFFNHWCPMVRAYYMRLLCWRICRDTGSATELDIKICALVLQRLKIVWLHFLWLSEKYDMEDKFPPSTAPCCPQPYKRFLIIRTEVPAPQLGLMSGPDSLKTSAGPAAKSGITLDATCPSTAGGGGSTAASSPGRDLVTAGPRAVDGTTAPPPPKSRWSLFNKVLSLANGTGPSQTTNSDDDSWTPAQEDDNNELDRSRRNLTTRSPAKLIRRNLTKPPPTAVPAPQGGTGVVQSSATSVSSTGSAPVFDAPKYIFRFTLQSMDMRRSTLVSDLRLTFPCLPAPSQARVRARLAALARESNNDNHDKMARRSSFVSPTTTPTPSPATRRVSGHSQTGLVNEARNAKPLDAGLLADARLSMAGSRLSMSLRRRTLSNSSTGDSSRSVQAGSPNESATSNPRPTSLPDAFSLTPPPPPSQVLVALTTRATSPDPFVGLGLPSEEHPVKPVGIYEQGIVYTGRALAEWSVVLSECNRFVSRRRSEGVPSLAEVEVPILSVDGFGMRRPS